jgi:hypothetical protein
LQEATICGCSLALLGSDRRATSWLLSAPSAAAQLYFMELLRFGLVVVGTLAACIGFGAFIGWRS